MKVLSDSNTCLFQAQNRLDMKGLKMPIEVHTGLFVTSATLEGLFIISKMDLMGKKN